MKIIGYELFNIKTNETSLWNENCHVLFSVLIFLHHLQQSCYLFNVIGCLHWLISALRFRLELHLFVQPFSLVFNTRAVRPSVRPPGFWCVGGFCWFLFEFIFFNMEWLVFGLNFNIAWLKQLLFNKYVRTWIARHFLEQPNQRTNDPRRIFKDNIFSWYFFGRRENEQRPQTDRSYFEIIVYLNEILDINTPLWLLWG